GVCLKYLSMIPVGLPGRGEAAALAVALAREVQARVAEGVHFLEGVERPVYEALLYAAFELPDEVAQIALELCKRRPEPQHAIKRGAIALERRKRQEAYKASHPHEAERG